MALLRSNHERLKARDDKSRASNLSAPFFVIGGRVKNYWVTSNMAEAHLYRAISIIFEHRSHLLNGFFDDGQPKLSAEPAVLLKHYRCLSSGEFVLMKVALDIWCSSGNAKIWEILDVLDIHNFSKVMAGLAAARSHESRDIEF